MKTTAKIQKREKNVFTGEKHIHMERAKIYQLNKKKLNVTIQQNGRKMLNFDYSTNENAKDHNQNWLQVPDNQCRLLAIRGCGSEKTNRKPYSNKT